MSPFYQPQMGSWNARIQLQEFVDPYQIARTALHGFWLFLLLGVALWAAFANKSRSAIALSVFKIHKFWTAIGLCLLDQIFTFTYLLLIQYQETVTAAFLLVETIFDEFFYPASVVLLATIFGLLFQLLQQPCVGYQRYRVLLWANYGLCAVLFVLYLALFGLRVHDLDQKIFDGELSTYLVNGYTFESVLDVTFDGLFGIAALEVLVGSIFILVTHRRYGTSNTIAILLFALIACPLFVQRIFALAFDANLGFTYGEVSYLGFMVADAVLFGGCFVLMFAGLVAIGVQSDDTDRRYDVENRAAHLQGTFAPSHAAPSEPISQDMNDKMQRDQGGHRWTGWRPQLPSFRKGGKSGLGVRMAF